MNDRRLNSKAVSAGKTLILVSVITCLTAGCMQHHHRPAKQGYMTPHNKAYIPLIYKERTTQGYRHPMPVRRYSGPYTLQPVLGY